jgi:geranylgeranyl diphosphate synthase, type I
MVEPFPFAGAYLEALEQELRTAVKSPSLPLAAGLRSDFLNIFQYHLGWTDATGRPVNADTGKRLRPLICLLSSESAGERDHNSVHRWHDALPAAAAIELVHNFSLIHDDIEDNSSERHGRPTVWKVWGTAQAINAGDALFVLARLTLDRLQRTVTYRTYADIHRFFEAATIALTQGQFLDLSFETRSDVTVDEYMEMIRGKTAALFSAAAQIGARVALGDARLVDAFARFGENLGISFQIADDILGIWGRRAVMGKPVGDDILARKKSLPLLAAAQHDPSGEIGEFLRMSSVSPEDAERITAVLDRAEARQSSEALALEYSQRALASLSETELSNPAIENLRQIARQSVGRDK